MYPKEVLLEAIKESFLTKESVDIYKKKNPGSMSNWLFDFRPSLGTPKYLDAYTELFYETYKDKYPFQVAGLETAAILLVGAVVQKMYQKGLDVNGFYIRKSRKKYGLLNMIEGNVNDYPVILVDDLINSGDSIIKSKLAIEEVGKKVTNIFSILRFKNDEYYKDFEAKNNIKITSLYKLEDLRYLLGEENFKAKEEVKNITNLLENKWLRKNAYPNYYYVVPKSFPVIYKNNIYFGKDDGNFVCVSKEGEPIWSYRIPFGSKGKYIFSTPIIHNGKVFFGAYDGNLYCLDAESGKVIWVNFDCDWVGSSPDISIKNNLVYVGAEYGFWKKKGGLIAVDIDTGKLKWAFREMPEYTHGSPLVIDSQDLVVCGSNDGNLYALNSKTGELKWKVYTGGEIKHRPAFDNKNKIIITADHGGAITGTDLNGKIVWVYKMIFGSYCIPKIDEDRVYVTSFDKNVYCLNTKTGELIWSQMLSARIFSSVETIGDQVIVGTNEGKVWFLDKYTGERKAVQIVSERVTNRVAYDKDCNSLYILDYVQNLYCFELKS